MGLVLVVLDVEGLLVGGLAAGHVLALVGLGVGDGAGEDVVAGTLGAYAGTFDEGQFVIGNVIDFDLDSGTYTIA